MEQEFDYEKEFPHEFAEQRKDPDHVLIKMKPCHYCGGPGIQMYIRSDENRQWKTYEEPICRICREAINYEIAKWRKRI